MEKAKKEEKKEIEEETVVELEPVTLSGQEYADLMKKSEEVEALNDKYKRLYAEFDNTKKLWEKQKIECLKFGSFKNS